MTLKLTLILSLVLAMATACKSRDVEDSKTMFRVSDPNNPLFDLASEYRFRIHTINNIRSNKTQKYYFNIEAIAHSRTGGGTYSTTASGYDVVAKLGPFKAHTGASYDDDALERQNPTEVIIPKTAVAKVLDKAARIFDVPFKDLGVTFRVMAMENWFGPLEDQMVCYSWIDNAIRECGFGFSQVEFDKEDRNKRTISFIHKDSENAEKQVWAQMSYRLIK